MRVETFDCPLGSVTLHAIAMGKGPLAILLHGITANAHVFLPLMERLAGRFRLVSIDLRGHGRSSKPATGYAAKDFADDIEALIRHLDRGPALLIGHALGARDAFVAGARDNGLVSGVVAIDFTPFIDEQVFGGTRTSATATGCLPTPRPSRPRCRRYPLTPPDAIELANYGYPAVKAGGRCPKCHGQTAAACGREKPTSGHVTY